MPAGMLAQIVRPDVRGLMPQDITRVVTDARKARAIRCLLGRSCTHGAWVGIPQGRLVMAMMETMSSLVAENTVASMVVCGQLISSTGIRNRHLVWMNRTLDPVLFISPVLANRIWPKAERITLKPA